MAGEIFVSTIVSPKPVHEFETLKSGAIEAASDTADAYIQNWTRYVIGNEEWHRGRMNEARDAAHELMQIGRQLNDPRSTGLGLGLLTQIALLADSYAEALEYSEQSLAVAITPIDRSIATCCKGSALVLLRRTDEGAKLLEEYRNNCIKNGEHYPLPIIDGVMGVCKVLQGNIGAGLHLVEDAISSEERAGYVTAADWLRANLAEVYLQIIAGGEKPPLSILFKNLPILIKVVVAGPSRIPALLAGTLENPRFDPAGSYVGRAHMILGLLYKAKKRGDQAVQHLTKAKLILSQFGKTPILARVDTALAELGQ